MVSKLVGYALAVVCLLHCSDKESSGWPDECRLTAIRSRLCTVQPADNFLTAGYVNDKLGRAGLINGIILNHYVWKPAAHHRNKAKLLSCNKSNFIHVLSGILLIITYICIMDATCPTKLTVKPYMLRIPALMQNLYSFDSDGKVIINGDWENIYTQEVALYFETLPEQIWRQPFKSPFDSPPLLASLDIATASFFILTCIAFRHISDLLSVLYVKILLHTVQ